MVNPTNPTSLFGKGSVLRVEDLVGHFMTNPVGANCTCLGLAAALPKVRVPIGDGEIGQDTWPEGDTHTPEDNPDSPEDDTDEPEDDTNTPEDDTHPRYWFVLDVTKRFQAITSHGPMMA
jgi:hypothetical protein